MMIRKCTILFLLSLVLGGVGPVPGANASLGEEGGFKLGDVKAALNDAIIMNTSSEQIHIRNLLFYTLALPQGVTLADYIVKSNAKPEQIYTLSSLDIDQQSRRFQGVLLAQNFSGAGIKLTGRFESVVDVPVLSQTLHRGDIISEEDLEWVAVPPKRLRAGTIRDFDQLVGKQLTRLIAAGKSLTKRDLSNPILIRKGDLVTIIYRKAYMELKTVGLAQSDAASGDVLAVKNERSGTVVHAQVQTNGEAIVNYTDGLLEAASHMNTKGDQG